MTTPLGFDALKGILHRRLAHLPDHRKASPNTRYAIHDAALSAFGFFFTQSPSFLEYQRRLQHAKGHKNAHTLFDVEQIPCDNQVRTLLDPIAPSHLDAVFLEVCECLEQYHMLAHFRVLGAQLLVALDGTNYFSSKAIHCQNCRKRQLSNGQILYHHAAITPVILGMARSISQRFCSASTCWPFCSIRCWSGARPSMRCCARCLPDARRFSRISRPSCGIWSLTIGTT